MSISEYEDARASVGDVRRHNCSPRSICVSIEFRLYFAEFRSCKNVGQRCTKQAHRSLLLTVENCRKSNDGTSGILRQSCKERKNEGMDTRCRRREKGIQQQSEGTTDSRILTIM